ncbi:hypothetical protein ACVWYO_003768 [Sphingomonas sp. UYP23]
MNAITGLAARARTCCARDRRLVRRAPSGILRAFPELANVRARAKRAGLRRAQHQHAHRGIGHRLLDQGGQRLPHRLGEGVALGRAVDQQMRDRAFRFEP